MFFKRKILSSVYLDHIWMVVLILIVEEAATRGVLCENVFLEILQNSEENTKKGLWHRCFPVNFVKFLR